MKKVFLILLFSISAAGYSQVGINQVLPKATLEIVGKPDEATTPDGVIVPKLTGDQLKAKDNVYLNQAEMDGTIVYVTEKVNTPSTLTADVLSPGYYYFDGSKWVSFYSSNNKAWFYAPSIALPTSEAGVPVSSNSGISYDATTDTFEVDLYSIYKKQFNVTDSNINSTFVKSDPSASLNSFESNELDYFIIYYDNSVYDAATITLSTSGILTYKILATGIVTQNTYMNVVFKEK
jgi:hypothetical protein